MFTVQPRYYGNVFSLNPQSYFGEDLFLTKLFDWEKERIVLKLSSCGNSFFESISLRGVRVCYRGVRLPAMKTFILQKEIVFFLRDGREVRRVITEEHIKGDIFLDITTSCRLLEGGFWIECFSDIDKQTRSIVRYGIHPEHWPQVIVALKGYCSNERPAWFGSDKSLKVVKKELCWKDYRRLRACYRWHRSLRLNYEAPFDVYHEYSDTLWHWSNGEGTTQAYRGWHSGRAAQWLFLSGKNSVRSIDQDQSYLNFNGLKVPA